MAKTLFAFALASLLFLLLLPDQPWTRWAILPPAVASAVFNAAFNVSANRANLSFIKETGLVGYTNAWNVFISLALGITPIVVGNIIDAWGLDGFRLCFAISGLGGILCALYASVLIVSGEVRRRGDDRRHRETDAEEHDERNESMGNGDVTGGERTPTLARILERQA